MIWLMHRVCDGLDESTYINTSFIALIASQISMQPAQISLVQISGVLCHRKTLAIVALNAVIVSCIRRSYGQFHNN